MKKNGKILESFDCPSKEDIKRLKEQVRKTGRLLVSQVSGMVYSTLTNKLNGYTPMRQEEFGLIAAVVKSLKEPR